ncbi:MAG: DUF721 domain-containing protein [Patescibacteria group bacterium]|nr:DUF721 domain-containing protein [Patescibacteria group bacterium]
MQSLKDLIKLKKRKSGLKRPLEIYELFGEWDKLVKAVFGEKRVRCSPRVLKGRTLIVEVGSAPAASELRLRQYQLVKKINDHFGRKMVERVVFKF